MENNHNITNWQEFPIDYSTVIHTYYLVIIEPDFENKITIVFSITWLLMNWSL